MAALNKKRKCDSLLEDEETMEVCVICNQKGNKAIERGVQKLCEAANARENVGDEQYREAIRRINDKTDHEESIPISRGLHWHTQCYSEFTHKVKIERLKEK